MARTGLWLRVLVALLVAVTPPVVLVLVAIAAEGPLLGTADPTLLAALLIGGLILWAAILAVVYARLIGDEVRAVLATAQRGEAGTEPGLGDAQRQVAETLDERNRQVATLAREVGAVPIDVEPSRVVTALVDATRSVMRDPTWRAAVLASDAPDILAPGIYLGSGDEEPRRPIGDLEQWAAMASAEAPVARREGPWGAFAIVAAASSGRLGAILYAPWEGRNQPSPAETAILALVGLHFSAAVEHALLYARVRTQADELDRLARVQADFLRGVTHDLQTPLTSIGALATELRADDTLSSRARADLDTITHQADRLRRMVSQLLVASRLEAGVLTPQIEVFAVQPLVERTWAALRADRPFELAVDGQPHLAVGDPDRLEQVLWALLDNAVKYSPPGSPIRVAIAASNGTMTIAVEDRGSGMDETARVRAFEQFYRSDDARRMAPDGSGVGLYAARGLVETMGGSIGLASTLGTGTRVRIALPAESSADTEHESDA